MRHRLFIAAVVVSIAALSGSPARAVGSFCSVTGQTAVSIGNYNPFSGTGFTNVPVTLNLTRYRDGSGNKTRQVDFYISQPAGSPAGYSITYNGSNVLYTQPASHTLSLPPPASGTVFYNFGGNGQPDTVSLPLTVTIPPGLDLTAGRPITFDIVYICTGSGALHDVTTPTTLPGAIAIQIDVLSALQASYSGPALSFGEISSVSDAQAPSHSVTGQIRVASTGPFTVAMSATHNYVMTYPGGNTAVAAESIMFSMRLAGETVDHTNHTFTAVACSAAGINGQNLPITATLQEGGATKNASPSYQEVLTVTLTPLAVPYNGTTLACPSL